MRLRIRVKPGAHEEKVSREPDGSLLVCAPSMGAGLRVEVSTAEVDCTNR